jgi:RimJ/RimL family protein N-acetyltransferase
MSSDAAYHTAVEIRRGGVDDAEGIWRCIDNAVSEGWFTFIEPPPLDAVRSSIMPDSLCFVAESNSRIVGWCDITPINQKGYRHSGTLGMALLPDFRNQGLGRKILDITVDAALKVNLSRIELQLLASNRPALALYERAGFVREGLKRAARVLDRESADILLMALLRAEQ